MNQRHEPDLGTSESLAQVNKYVQCQMSGRVRDFRLLVRTHGLVQLSNTRTRYAKPFAQYTVMEAISLPIRAGRGSGRSNRRSATISESI